MSETPSSEPASPPPPAESLRGFVDFRSAAARRRAGATQTAAPLVARAVGLDRGVRSVIDATGGFGRDALALALRGASVVVIERHPLLAEMLAEELAALRLAGDPLAARLTVVPGDAREILAALPDAERPDAIHLDPMFEESGKRALPKRAAQALRTLLGSGCDDAAGLLAIARRVAKRRVAVKRHGKAPPLAQDPIARIGGTRIRYDIYAPVPPKPQPSAT
ncbi:MAG: class I SAM-dependent methyltransferase [Planctomycetes bacterium]|nr:class I SAM-dependent methyltransferase [Planctomycetota bacterium]